MEPDTMPYDGDEAAWQGWQVPAPGEPVPAMGLAPCDQEDIGDAAVAPTIAYDSAGDFATTIAYPLGVAGDDGTLAYEAGSPGGVPQVADVRSVRAAPDADGLSVASPTLAEPQEDVAPTLLYGETLVLEAAEEAPGITPEATDNAPSASSSLLHPGGDRCTTSPARASAEPVGDWLAPIRNSSFAKAVSTAQAVCHEKQASPDFTERSGTPQQQSETKTPTKTPTPMETVAQSSTASVANPQTPIRRAAASSAEASSAEASPAAASPAAASTAAASSVAASPVTAAPAVAPAAAPAAAPADSSAARSGLAMRLNGKQPPPAGYVAPAPVRRPRTAAKPRAKAPRVTASAAASPAARRKREPPAASDDPRELGCKVRVNGDGWGGGQGEYEGIVTQSDELSFTVIFKGDDKKWEETHVLREHCQLIEPDDCAGEERRAQRRRTA